ncbi:type I polyketide synthase [Streptomyces sp. NBC_00554]|uniref:beta-ketoacyl synthase N-terminal-like domain-containing protein n=1 Tax=Streptomyces sp. NBC_00554 TaxID=2903661 RepID=UPI00352FD9F1|nr:type I polyketide synthase [Streptomyces sp. NBC_00554]
MTAADAEALRRLITERVASWAGTAPAEVAGDRPLADYGMSSRDAVALTGELVREIGRALPATLLWETSTVDGLVRRLSAVAEQAPLITASGHAMPLRSGRAGRAPRGGTGGGPPPAWRLGGAPTGRRPGESLSGERGLPATLPEPSDEPVAVVGVGCRLPGGVRGPGDYWRLLTDGTDAVSTMPADRWSDFTAPPDTARQGGYLGSLDEIAGFDAEFFRISPSEAAVMDPQQRMLLEVVHEALDHAAIPAASLAGTATGVWVGISSNEYGQLTGTDPAAVDHRAPTGAAPSIAAGRLSYVLDLRGPSVAIDTACSSSLVAVHQACVSLRTGESDMALAAGVNLLLAPAVTVAFGRAGALAPDGRCKSFSADADGIGRSEGCAVAVLKRLPDALRDGDRVLAVIRATAVNSDGRSNGLMAPNPEAQRALLEAAYGRAGLDPATVDLVEAHGTGTPLGDPIEADALTAVLGRERDLDQPLLLGSAKSNLGHLESAAGIAGLVKTVLALHHDRIPPSLHCERPAPADPRLRVVTEPEPWPRYGGTAVAGVSAFGFGGTNAHAVLEEWQPSDQPPATPAPPDILQLSDADAARVRDTAGRIADWLDTPDGRTAGLGDLARTLAGRTGRGPVRAAVTARDRPGLTASLRALAEARPDRGVVTGDRDRIGPGVVWVFSGYGGQWPGMGRELLAAEPAFAAAVEKLEPALAAACGISLHESLERGTGLDRLDTAQPVLFGMQVALAELWRAYGVEPAAVIGHSMGEVAAAVTAGGLDPEDGARVIAVRSRLLTSLSGGAMAVVDLDDTELAAISSDFPGVHVAVHSSPGQKVVTGEAAAVARLADRLTALGRPARTMPVRGAGHSPQVDPLLPELTARLDDVRGKAAPVRGYSTVHDDPRAPTAYDAAHWAANLRRPVRLAQALAAAAEDGHTAFVEISPHPTLLHPLAQTLPDALALPTLRRGTDAPLTFRGHVAALHAAGHPLPAPPGRVIDVPGPRWRHTRHWWTDRPAPATATASAGAATDGEEEVSSAVRRLLHHFAAVTGHLPEHLGPATALADLGLDSLMAARIRVAVEAEFGVELPLRELLRSTTIHDVAAQLGLAPEPGVPEAGVSPRTPPLPEIAGRAELRALRSTGTRPPLFLAHAAGGPTTVYRNLAELLGPDQPVIGLERIEEAGTVAAKARRYAEAIRIAYPNGPYRLGGWSFGGFVAQETARLLTAAGQDVDAVILIDSVRPLPVGGDRTRAHFEGFAQYVADTYGARLDLPYDVLAAMDDRGRIERVLRILREAADIPPAALEHQRTSYLDLRIGEAHTPGPYAGRVILYRATEPAPHTVRDPAYERVDDALGWDEVCPDLEVVRIGGHHLSLLDPPHVNAIAEHLDRMF